MQSATTAEFSTNALSFFSEQYGDPTGAAVVSVPGRVNLIGEHIDYHLLGVLPMAIQRRITVAFRKREDKRIYASSRGFGLRETSFESADRAGFPNGDWGTYVRAAVLLTKRCWSLRNGVDLAIVSNLPEAAGLSSSSALLTGLTLALLRANYLEPSLSELMNSLPEGEQVVGTRGGGMDHAAVLASRAGCAIWIRSFLPLNFRSIPIPSGWSFLVAHSLTKAEKSGALREEYNRRRAAGSTALMKLGFRSFPDALQDKSAEELLRLAANLPEEERRAFRHVITEMSRVQECVTALEQNAIERFGAALAASHESLRSDLRVSNVALDRLVNAAMEAGATGARLTGAGFGGCGIVLCRTAELERVRKGLIDSFYRDHVGFQPEMHLLVAEPSEGALS